MANIRTFADLGKDDPGPGDKNQDFYAGGASSGMVVQGGGMREAMLRAARENQVQPRAEDDWGSGRQVGAQMEAPRLQQKAKVTLTIYNNGFCIDNERFRGYDDNEQNREFLDCVRRGEIPPELRQRGREIDVTMEVKHSDYVQKKTFSSSNAVGSAPAPAAVASNSYSPVVADDLVVDSTQKITTVQVRAQGGKFTFKANYNHTVGDLYRYVERATNIPPPFTICTTFPKKQLTNREQTLQEAELINAAVIVTK
eukprot:CAMPEP_0201514764 /NCGR_PEP_ID=MMETSP0161_2-20130828/6518_1 /ASSEMBLY_ACC=CAM_ASM_000251 /TAXON_ID=180227 /ORGANISM="Neoparamoeba aestuarina, Strain SoJaBio B1-5/56/2" /LENGTH=254 /DNA_ID=CAMNT_0047911409 /DNA_START=34 /DNA_END=798 /DNA_ORIENTATION=-